MYAMKRTTVFLTGAQLAAAKRYAQRHGKSFAEVVREAVTAYISGPPAPGGKLPSVAGQFGSGRADTSERVDQLLWSDPHR